MATLVSAKTRLLAWIEAVERLVDVGPSLNVILDIADPLSEGKTPGEINRRIDDYLLGEDGGQPLHTVAETIFPGWEYRRRGIRGVYESYAESFAIMERGGNVRWGTYAQRLIQRKDASGKVINPLKDLIAKMAAERKQGGPMTARYELGVAEGANDVPLYDTTDDRGFRRGGPCLSHTSFKLSDDQVHLTALYRSHDYSLKVLGNLLGLARLQACVANEIGARVGTLVVHSTYATFGQSKLRMKALAAELRPLA